jgi:WD40 repeat protein
MDGSSGSFPTQTLSERHRSLCSENRRLRERLLELCGQLNTLSSISDSLDPPAAFAGAAPARAFARTHSAVLPGGALYCAASDPAGERAALGSLSGSVAVLDAGLRQSAVLAGHALACRDVSWTAAGLASCSFDRTVRLWDLETGASRAIATGGLAHSVARAEGDANALFAAAGDQVLWIDARRAAPIAIPAGAPATAVAVCGDRLLFGGYAGDVAVVDRRALHAGRIATVAVGGGPVSALSRCLPPGICVATSAGAPPRLIEVADTVVARDLGGDAPGRFGCRADITGRGMVFRGRFAAVCGGKTATFVDGDERLAHPLETPGGFQYGAIFMASIAQKILTYSEDGVVALWAPHS